MGDRAKKWVLFALRWGIAVVGIAWVVSQISWRDHVWVLDERNHPVRVAVLAGDEDAGTLLVRDPATSQGREVARGDLVNPPDQKNGLVTIVTPEGNRQVKVLGLDLAGERASRLLVLDPRSGDGMWIDAAAVVGGYDVKVPRPRVEVGIRSLLRGADPWLLWAAVAIFPFTFLITSYRWNTLLAALDIRLTQARTFVLNMVGAFYNTFMLGSTGGDLLKAYYASRQTPHRARAVISVLVDRIIGLLALVMLGGTMALYQYVTSPNPREAAARACLRVALASALILFAVVTGLVVLGQRTVRRRVGLDYILHRLPFQRHVQHVIQVMRMYRDKPGLVLGTILMTLPVHITVVISAMLAGQAFGLPLPAGHYFVVVPVVVLSGAIPISPQGAGIMEFFAIQLTKQYGTTVSQAFALTMSIRLVQMMWNLAGGIFVLRGGYHRPTETEQRELDEAEAAEVLVSP